MEHLLPKKGSDNISKPSRLPLVSVVTPSFNALPFLKENIESILEQDYPSIEHIIIDGGSADGTLEVLKRYPHLVWVSEPDRGQSHALNKGFRRARGEIIGWLNADDSYQPDAVSNAVRLLLENEDADIIYSDLQVIDEAGQSIGISKAQPFDLCSLLLINPVKQPTVFIRRHVIEKMCGVDESLHYVMDREFWLRAGFLFNIHYFPGKIFANYRLCPGTKSFEQTVEFKKEWLQVLEQKFQNPNFSKIPRATWRNAMQKTKAQYHLAKLIYSANHHDRWMMFQHLILAITRDMSLVMNRGTWLFIYNGLFGRIIDMRRKYNI